MNVGDFVWVKHYSSTVFAQLLRRKYPRREARHCPWHARKLVKGKVITGIVPADGIIRSATADEVNANATAFVIRA